GKCSNCQSVVSRGVIGGLLGVTIGVLGALLAVMIYCRIKKRKIRGGDAQKACGSSGGGWTDGGHTDTNRKEDVDHGLVSLNLLNNKIPR
ncbi:hypothetical protein SRHO_G00100920, partial [Serrasalmus rhombeus]